MSNLLTICIPTYARPDLLFATVLALIEQAAPINVPIVISDNSEDLRTSNVVDRLKLIYENIKYARNEKNIGIDRNFLKAAELATSDFVWFFGDDDLPAEGAVSRILEEISCAANIDFFLINSKAMSNDMSRVISDNILGITEDRLFDDHAAALREISWYSTFIGAFVVRRSTWQSIDPTPYLDTVFVHVGIMFTAMSQYKFPLKIISMPLIFYRTGPASWSNNFLRIQFTLWRLAIERLPSNYDDVTRRISIESVVERFVTFGTLANARIANGLSFYSFFTNLIPYFFWARKRKKGTWRVIFFATLLLFIPRYILLRVRGLWHWLKCQKKC